MQPGQDPKQNCRKKSGFAVSDWVSISSIIKLKVIYSTTRSLQQGYDPRSVLKSGHLVDRLSWQLKA